jgi:hypothetical protein
VTVVEVGLAGAWLAVLLTLLVTLALVRRVNMLATHVAGALAGSREGDELGLDEGDALPPFHAPDVSGQTRRSEDLIVDQPALIALLSATCPGCRDQLPVFNAVSRRASQLGWASIVIVSGGDDVLARDLVSAIEPTALVLVPGQDGEQLSRDLRIAFSPTYYIIGRDGRVLTREFSAQALRKPMEALERQQQPAL